MKTLITNGTIVTATDTYVADILVVDDKIALIGQGLAAEGAQVIDAKGKRVYPGAIDVHTHFDLPFMGTVCSDDFETGTIAAAFGGTTSIIDFAIQGKGQSLQQALDTWMAKARGKAVIDYGFHVAIGDMTEAVNAEMADMVAGGITSFKLFLAYKGSLMVDDGALFKALRRAGQIGAMICIHGENGDVVDILVKEMVAAGKTTPYYHCLSRPPEVEAEATGRAIAFAEIAEAPVYIVHLTSAHALARVKEARDNGQPAFAETCPQYLLLSIDNCKEPGFEGAKYVMSPPLREKWHQDVLWSGLASGDLQVVSTDHAPFNFKGQKDMFGTGDFSKIPNGAPGVETRLYLVYSKGFLGGWFDENRFVDLVATQPAKLFGFFPRKGTIAVGSDADLLIWDPKAKHTLSQATLHQRVDYCPYEGTKVTGKPAVVLSRGKVIVEGDKFLGKPGAGQFLKRGQVWF